SLAAASELQKLAVLAFDDNGRTQILAAAGGAPIGDHALGDAGRLIVRLRHRLAFDQVLEADRTLDFVQDGPRIMIPLGQALAASEIAAVALAANPIDGLAREHRADADLLDAGGADRLHLRLFDQGAALDQHDIAGRILDVLRGGTSENPAAERSHDLAGIDD